MVNERSERLAALTNGEDGAGESGEDSGEPSGVVTLNAPGNAAFESLPDQKEEVSSLRLVNAVVSIR